MGLFSSKPKMQTIVEMGHKFEYMEFVKGYPLPDDVKILENMVSFYRNHSSYNLTKSEIKDGYISKADYHDILIKYFQLGGKMNQETLDDMRDVSSLMVNYGTHRHYNTLKYLLNPDTLKNKALGIQLWKKMVEQYLALSCIANPTMKLSLAVSYLNKYPDNYAYITDIMSEVASEEMDLCRSLGYFMPENLTTTAVLEYLEHDWPAFYEAEFGYLPEGAPETVSGILKKYNLTPAQYYEKAAKGGGGKKSIVKAVSITPACVISEMFKAAHRPLNDRGDADDAITYFSMLLTNNIKEEMYQYHKRDLLAESLKQHMFADIGLAAFMMADFNFPNTLPAFGGKLEVEGDKLVAYKTNHSLSQYRIADAGYARMMQRHGFPESMYESEAMYGEFTFSEVYRLADRARDLKFKTKAENSILFEPEI